MITRLTFLRNWRATLVQGLEGCLLEIGAGTGANFPYYRRASCVCAIEPDTARATQAQRVSRKARVALSTTQAYAEALPYPDHSFDHVISSLVLCSVTDPTQVLGEIKRVLKPNGILHMVEHVRPQNHELAQLFSFLTPWWSRFAHNCHLDRPTIETVCAAGWRVHIHKRRAMLVWMTAKPSPQ